MRASFTFRPCSIICQSGPANAGSVAPIASTPMSVTSKFFMIEPLTDCLATKNIPVQTSLCALVQPPAIPNSQFNWRIKRVTQHLLQRRARLITQAQPGPRHGSYGSVVAPWIFERRALTACGAQRAANDELARPYRTGRFHIASNGIGHRWSNASEGPRGEYRAYALDESLHQPHMLSRPVTIHSLPLPLPAHQSGRDATACGATEGTPLVPRTSIAAVL